MSEFDCSVRRGPEMCRTNGDVGLQLQVNVYPVPKDLDLTAIAELISDAVDAYEAEE